MSSAPLVTMDFAVVAFGYAPWAFLYASSTRARIPATSGDERDVPCHSSLATAPFGIGMTMFSGVEPTDIRPFARMSTPGCPRALGPRLENGTTSPYDPLTPFSRPE